MAPGKSVQCLSLTDHSQFRIDVSGTNLNLNVTVTHKAEAIQRWISAVEHGSRRLIRSRLLIVGLSFGGEHNGSVSTIHLSVARKCLIIQLHGDSKTPLQQSLVDFFSDKRINFVGMNNARHAMFLREKEICNPRIHDVKEWLFEEKEKPNYKDIVEKCAIGFQFVLDPQISNSNWNKRTLSNRQIYQGATDAFVCLRIGVKTLRKRLLKLESGMNQCKIHFLELKEKRIRSMICKIENDQVIVEKLGERQQSYNDFASTLPRNECRYAIYDFEFVTEEKCHKNMIFFIAWSPNTAKGRDEMIYASFEDTFERKLDGIQVKLQATDPTEMGPHVFKSHTYMFLE